MENGRVVIRPVCADDLNIVCAFGEQIGFGFTSLTSDSEVMLQKINKSLLSFSSHQEQKSRHFFFVMELYEQNQPPFVIGTCAIDAPQGNTGPLYNYKISTVTQLSEKINKYKQHKILELVTDYQNTSQLSALFLQKSFRGYHRGELLSRSRSLFISEFPHFFSDIIFAQMRGVIDEAGNSLFWDSIGRYFFEMDFKDANYLRMTQGEQFISDLMPTYPIYVELLSKEFQQIIGEPHVDTRGALRLLMNEGFKNRGYADIFEGGPIIEAYKSELKTALESKSLKIHSIKKNALDDMNRYALAPKMISNTRLDFRATLGEIELLEPDLVCLEEDVANLLNVSVGDNVRFCDLHKRQ